jgi:hypothetical protein
MVAHYEQPVTLSTAAEHEDIAYLVLQTSDPGITPLTRNTRSTIATSSMQCGEQVVHCAIRECRMERKGRRANKRREERRGLACSLAVSVMNVRTAVSICPGIAISELAVCSIGAPGNYGSAIVEIICN